MFARFGIELILVIIVGFGAFLLFERCLRSRFITKLIKGAVPPPETDAEVLDAYHAADSAAEKQATTAEQEAITKINSAAKLKSRRKS